MRGGFVLPLTELIFRKHVGDKWKCGTLHDTIGLSSRLRGFKRLGRGKTLVL